MVVFGIGAMGGAFAGITTLFINYSAGITAALTFAAISVIGALASAAEWRLPWLTPRLFSCHGCGLKMPFGSRRCGGCSEQAPARNRFALWLPVTVALSLLALHGLEG